MTMTGDNHRASTGAPRNELIYLYWMHVLTKVRSECGQPPKIKKENEAPLMELCSTNHNKIELEMGRRH